VIQSEQIEATRVPPFGPVARPAPRLTGLAHERGVELGRCAEEQKDFFQRTATPQNNAQPDLEAAAHPGQPLPPNGREAVIRFPLRRPRPRSAWSDLVLGEMRWQRPTHDLGRSVTR